MGQWEVFKPSQDVKGFWASFYYIENIKKYRSLDFRESQGW
jgi:hypothetical protein